MAEVEVKHSRFARIVGDKFKVGLSLTEAPVYWCDSCGCMFLGNSEGEMGYYPDRYEIVGSKNDGCGTNCPCHRIPYMMDLEGNATEF